MATRMQEFERRRAGGGSSAGTIVPIILDGGEGARVIAIELAYRPFVGMRFEYGGMLWQITHAKDALRGWVARAAEGEDRAAS
jgi:hypothetical protein